MPDPSQAAAALDAAQHIKAFPTDFAGFVSGTWQVWVDGGWVMIPLGLVTILAYYEVTALFMHLSKTGITRLKKTPWTQWIDNPEAGTGHFGEVIRYVLRDGFNAESIVNRISSVRQALIPEVNQKITLISVYITVAPLLGLFGTVIGMLTTFKGLAVNTGQTIDMVAEGIRVALITTQTGLQIAIPGYIFLSLTVRRRNEYNAFLATLESTLVQKCHLLEKEKAEKAGA